MRPVILLLAGCSSPGPDCAEGYVQRGNHCELPEPADPEPELPEVDRPTATPVWGPAEIETAIQTALIRGFPNVWELHDGYFDMLAHGDEFCPGHETYIDDTWLYGCTAQSGYWFAGVSEYWYEEQHLDLADLTTWVIAGDFEFRDDQGRSLMVGGGVAAQHWRELDTGTAGWFTEIQGTWIDQSSETWLEEGVSGAVEITLIHSESDDEIWMSGAVGFSGIQLYANQLQLQQSCDWGMAGDLSIRDPSGAWHEIEFGHQCTPCGKASFAGQPEGDVCPDLTPLASTFLPMMEMR